MKQSKAQKKKKNKQQPGGAKAKKTVQDLKCFSCSLSSSALFTRQRNSKFCLNSGINKQK